MVGGVLRVTVRDGFDTEELRAAVAAVVLAPDFRGPVPVLFDLRDGYESASADEIQRRAQLAASRPDLLGPCVAVVVSSPVQFGIARMGASFAELDGLAVGAFTELEAALAWLRDSIQADRPADQPVTPPAPQRAPPTPRPRKS